MKNDLLGELGFAPPEVEYVRDDPRGYEYGYYGVELNVKDDQNIYTVYKYTVNKSFEYALEIRGDFQFRKWVQDIF